MLKLWRVNSFFPSSSSSAFSALERVGCVTCSCAAARDMFSSRATARKYFRVRISIVIPSCYEELEYHDIHYNH